MGPYDVRDLLRLYSIPGIGPLKFRALVTHFGEPGAALAASPRQLVRVRGIDPKLASFIARHRGSDAFADDQLRRLNRLGASIISWWDPHYPELLKRIYDPPPLLFTRGEVRSVDSRALALVGTRLPSAYGTKVTERLAEGLVRSGATVVSGLARGIDTLAHEAALRAGGRTLAVPGSGLDVPYPPENRSLMDRIEKNGAVITEFPMGAKPDAGNFPRRNRVVSGLCLGTIIVESAIDGGAMITAAAALDQNREVFAVPGSMFESTSSGPHALIRDGRAKLVASVEDILAELPVQFAGAVPSPTVRPPQELTLFERATLDVLGEELVHVDAIGERSGLSTSDTLVALLGLEFKGLVRQLPGKWFVKR